MVFGKKKSSSENNKLSMPTMTTPFGQVKGNSSGAVQLRPYFLPGQEESMNTASTNFGEAMRGVPTSLNINEAFDNPISRTLMELTRSDMGREAERARLNLNQTQAARGNLNNSSGLYAQSLLDDNIFRGLSDNLLKGRLAGFDAYRGNIQDQMNRASFFQNALTTTQNQILEPLRLYQGIAPISNQLQMYNNPAQAQGGGGGSGLFSSLMSSAGGMIPKLLAGG
jgi:hypothetical protein